MQVKYIEKSDIRENNLGKNNFEMGEPEIAGAASTREVYDLILRGTLEDFTASKNIDNVNLNIDNLIDMSISEDPKKNSSETYPHNWITHDMIEFLLEETNRMVERLKSGKRKV